MGILSLDSGGFTLGGSFSIYSRRFLLETVSQLHARRTCPIRVLRRITFILDELDIPWDLNISSIFSRKDSTLFDVCTFADLSSTAADLSLSSVPSLLP